MSKQWFKPDKVSSFGHVDPGGRGFGSFMFETVFPKEKVIVEHNLSTFWNRPHLPGEASAFPKPIVASREFPGSLTRFPGSFNFDEPEVHLRDRNLVAAKNDFSINKTKIWTVSEQSDQKLLEHYTIDLETVSFEEIQPFSSKQLPGPAQELRVPSERTNARLWIRTKFGLYLQNNDTGFLQVFAGGINTFHENPFLNEIAICDGQDFVWIGQPGFSLSRVKNKSGIASRRLSFTNHPRILLSADDYGLRLLDVRADNTQTTVQLYETADWAKLSSRSRESIFNPIEQVQPFNRAQILHIFALQDAERFCLVVTRREIVIVDSYYPKSVMLSIGHGVEGMVHYVELVAPRRDPIEGGVIYDIYLLSHLPSRLLSIPIYHHTNGSWSTIQAPKACKTPDTYLDLICEDTLGAAYKPLFGPTRSIAVVSPSMENNHERRDQDFVILALDDGSLWCQSKFYDETLASQIRTDVYDASLETIENYIEKYRNRITPYLKGIPESILPERQELIKNVSIDLKLSAKEEQSFWEPIEMFDVERLTSSYLEKGSSSNSAKVIRNEPDEKNVLTRLILDFMQEKPVEVSASTPSWQELYAPSSLGTKTVSKPTPDPESEPEFELEPSCYGEGQLSEEDLFDPTPDPSRCGFRGSYYGFDSSSVEGAQARTIVSNDYDYANLAQTYSALLSLLILEDDLSRVDKKAILEAIRLSQREDGCFWSQGTGSESDMRFIFCAIAICHVFDDFSPINWDKLKIFIRSSLSYDGGMGQTPGDEAHGGSTFCAIASLSLCGKLWDESVLSQTEIMRLIKWAVHKQEKGFHGRVGKPDDTCYAFWIGATLKMLNAYSLCSASTIRDFLLSAQHNHMGGFAKLCEDGAYPDMLHTYFSLAALSLQGEPYLRALNPALNLSQRAYEHLQKIRSY